MVFLAGIVASSCSDDQLAKVSGGIRVRVINIGLETASVAANVRKASGQVFREMSGELTRPETQLFFETLPVGAYEARVFGLDAAGAPTRSVWVSAILVMEGQVTEIVVDLADAVDLPVPVEICDGIDNDGDGQVDELENLPLCTRCADGWEQAMEDDLRCGEVDCDGLDRFELRGDNSAAGESTCVKVDYGDLTTARCAEKGRCASPNGPACHATEAILAQAGKCETITLCESGMPVVAPAPDGTPCGDEKICSSGMCVEIEQPPPEPPPPPPPPSEPAVGCADGTREGFLSLTDFPAIAACSGAWTVGGVLRPNATPTCGRRGGDDGAEPEGNGCSAMDLCAEGWHICLGQEEVGARAPSGCAAAVPPGARDKSLFFAVAQHSRNNSVCDPTTGDNDVFGCGNLGTVLGPDKGCGALNRVLASPRSGTCGYNEAEPPLGPWQCLGAADSHLHEGALVTKSACGSRSCSYDGQPLGTSDKGGVLCCRDGLAP